MTIDDVDLVEINEAFAAHVLPSARHTISRSGVDEVGLGSSPGMSIRVDPNAAYLSSPASSWEEVARFG
jgi:acetyl-CoA acetyltransferase